MCRCASTAVEKVLEGHKIDDAIIAQAEAAASAAVDPADDIHASGVYRKHLIGVMVERALRSASRVSLCCGRYLSSPRICMTRISPRVLDRALAACFQDQARRDRGRNSARR